jgi:hypothetical protein
MDTQSRQASGRAQDKPHKLRHLGRAAGTPEEISEMPDCSIDGHPWRSSSVSPVLSANQGACGCHAQSLPLVGVCVNRIGMESCSFLKKRTKRLLLPDAGSKMRDLAGKYVVYQEGEN